MPDRSMFGPDWTCEPTHAGGGAFHMFDSRGKVVATGDKVEKIRHATACVNAHKPLADRIAELEADLAEQCRLNVTGSEREVSQHARIAELETANASPLAANSELAALLAAFNAYHQSWLDAEPTVDQFAKYTKLVELASQIQKDPQLGATQ